MRAWNTLLSCALFVLTACKGHHDEHDMRSEVQLADATDDVKIPASLWELLEEKAGPVEKKAEVNFATVEKSASYVFTPIKVFLDEKNDGVLKKPKMDLLFARGGGTIDMADFVTSQRGSFFVKFDLAEEMKGQKDLKVFFVSGAKKRKINEEVLGAGCNTYFDLTKKFDGNFIKQALKVNTTRDRHVSVLSGTFVFSVKKESQIYISQVSFTDSRNKHLLCDM